MRAIACLLLLLTCLPLEAERLRVATYNVRNYLEMGRRIEGFWKEDYPKPAEELAAIREVIRFARPEVLAIQEIGSPQLGLELLQMLRAEGHDYPFAYFGEQPDEPRRLAVLSKREAAAWQFHSHLDFPYLDGQRERVKRGLLELTFGEGAGTWRLFVVHLKSRYTETSADPLGALRREREARAIRDYLRARFPPETQPRLLIVGDFNDHRDSPAVRRFLTVGDVVLGHLVPAYDRRGETWTYHYAHHDVYERVDYLIASPALFPRILHRRGGIADPLPAANLASDHRLVWIDLNPLP